MTEANLFAQQEANKRKSAWLVAGFVLFFAWVGFGGIWRGTFKPDRPAGALSPRRPVHWHHRLPPCRWHLPRSAWRTGAKRVLNASGAQELITPATPELQRLDNVVEEMAIASGVPKPKIWIVPDRDPNAFATGRILTAHRGDPGPARRCWTAMSSRRSSRTRCTSAITISV